MALSEPSEIDPDTIPVAIVGFFARSSGMETSAPSVRETSSESYPLYAVGGPELPASMSVVHLSTCAVAFVALGPLQATLEVSTDPESLEVKS
jgi:hypothetical protein